LIKVPLFHSVSSSEIESFTGWGTVSKIFLDIENCETYSSSVSQKMINFLLSNSLK
jgi:hypothetical protein